MNSENQKDTEIDNLIDGLSSQLKPVKKLTPIKWRTLSLILSTLVILFLVMKSYSGLSWQDFHWELMEKDLFFLIQIILMLITLISTTVIAFVSIIPGRYKKKSLLLPITTFTLLLISIAVNYLSMDQVVHEHRSLCMVEISFLALIPFFIMLKMLKKGFFISEDTTLTLGALASALFPTIIMHFTCSTHPTHVFIYHFLPLFLFAYIIPKIYLKFLRNHL